MHHRKTYRSSRKIRLALMVILSLLWGLSACDPKANDNNANSSALTDSTNSPATGSLGDADRAPKQHRAVGRPATVGNPGQLTWQRRFDDQDRLTTIVDPAGRETRFEYTTGVKHALRITKTTAEGSQVVWEFDELGRLVRMIDDAGRVDYG